EEHGAPSARLARHLFVTTTTAPPGKEVRVTGTGRQLAERRREAGGGGPPPLARARWASAAWHTAAWAVFGGAYVGAVVYVAAGLDAPAGQVLLVLAAGAGLSAHIGGGGGGVGRARLHWGGGGRDRLPAGHLAGRIPPPGLAGGLRRLLRRSRRRAGPRLAERGHRGRGRVVPLPRHRAAGARGREPQAARGRGRGHRGRERRGQDHAREA